MKPFIKIRRLSKTFGTVKALQDVSLDVTEGELFGLIGPDGSGKTTLFRIVATLLLPDTGSVTINELDAIRNYRGLRKILGYMPGRFSLYMDLTVRENLEFYASVYNTSVQQNFDLIKPVYTHLQPFENRRVGQLSGGMKQKLALSCALIHRPRFLVLDEPTTGVDAVSRIEFWEILHLLQKEGITILVSTPYMDEASRCSRVGLIQKGKILKIDAPENIIADYRSRIFSITAKDMFRLLRDLRDWKATRNAWMFGHSIHWSGTDPEIKEESLQNFLKGKGYENVLVKNVSPGMEDCFMELMQESEQN